MPNIRVLIDEDGTCRAEFFGYSGPSCLQAADELRTRLAALGITFSQEQIVAKPELLRQTEQQTAVQSEAVQLEEEHA